MKFISAEFWRTKKTFYYGIAGLIFLSLVIGIWGLDYLDELDLAAIPNQPNSAPIGKVLLVVKLGERILEVYNDGVLYKKYRIAVGKGETPTPIGEWNVVWKDYNWGSGFGTRWMGLNVPWSTFVLEYKITVSQNANNHIVYL